MELEATQIYEDDEISPTQRIPHTTEEEELVQVGTLSINSNEYQIKKGITKIGRHISCDIVINDMTVSKIHAEIEAMRNQGSRIWICDLNSSNKTKLDNEILLPTRLYEVKDGNIITFGRVRATYHAYRPMVIPETPAPSRNRVTDTVIPSTPDSSVINSSSDGSVILGTQRDEQNNVFRRPLIPQQRHSTSINEKNTSGASNDLQTAIMHTSNINISENREPNNIFDMETQNIEGHKIVASNSIHDTETQIFPIDESTHLIQANTKAKKQLQSNLSVQDEVTSISTDISTDIHDMETQRYESYINELETRKSENNILNLTQKKITTDIHNAETQNYINDTNKDGGNTKKFEIDKNKNQKKDLDQVECNINDLETQKFSNKDIAEDLCNVETQPEMEKNQLEMDGIENDANNDRGCTDKDIIKTTENKTIDDNEKDKDNMIETIKTKINDNNVVQSPNSRSSSPGSLNLSSPGVDEDLSSLHSDHLLESSKLLEYFGEGIDKLGASNTSTPKSHMKTSSERDNNAENISNNDEDNIFDALTQNIHEFEKKSDEINEKDVIRKLPKKKHGSKESIDDDLEMDTEEHPEKLIKNQCKSLEISDKSCNDNIDNKNDPSVESEDIFDALTQHLNSPVAKDTSNSSINQLTKINETDAIVDDMAPTQIINKDGNIHDQDNLTSKSSADINNAIEDKQKKHVSYKKTEESFQAISDDSLEQKLNEMFDNVNNSSIHEPPHISTQALESILESSCDNDLSADKYTANKSSLTDSVSQTHPADIETNNVNEMEIDSQISDTYFSTLTSRRKRNILKETQEIVDSKFQDVFSHQDSTLGISKINNEKDNDNTTMKFKKTEKKISKSRKESDTVTDTLNDNNITETTSNGSNKKNFRRLMRGKHKAMSEMDKQVLRKDLNKVKVDDVEKDSGSELNVCAPCPSEDAERTQTSGTLNESDDDILTRLPAVRISGTLSNPASPSTSSTSSECSVRSKRNIVKGKNKNIIRNKSLRKQNIEDSEKNESPNQTHDKPSVLLDNHMTNFNVSKTNKIIKHPVDTSEDSENEVEYQKRFVQIANRILNNDQHDKKDVQNTFDKKTSARFSPNLSKNLKQDIDDELKSSSQTSSRVTRHSSKQNDESSNVSLEKIHMENATYDKSTKSETRSIIARRKRTLIKKNEFEDEQMNLRKRKANQVIEERPIFTRTRRNMMKTAIERQSPNILDYSTKTSSRENSPAIGNTKSVRDNKIVPETALEESQKVLNLKTDENVDSRRSNIKRSKRKIIDDQTTTVDVVIANKSNNNNKQVQTQERQTEMNLLQDKARYVLKVVLSPIKNTIINPIDDESQEVEMIMRQNLNNVQDKNLSIRETNTAKIFQRKSRIRSRKQLNTDIETDSALTESSKSIIDDSNNTQSDESTSKAKSRKRYAESSVAGIQPLEKKEIFKKPRVSQNSASSVFDSSTEDSISESSQNSIENDISSNSRSSRSKTASIRKKERIEMTRNTRSMVNNSSKINTSIEITSPPSTPSTRMRRSTSVLSNSTPSATKHKVLFTGITEDYSKIVKTLGGNKVQDPARCSILVTDKVRRTYKFLCALAKGIPIVTIDWLRDSEAAARFLDWEDYILKDPAAEAKFGFKLRKSLDKAKETKLLDGYTVILTSNVAPPPIDELKDMITSCGGKALLRPPNKWPEKSVIISREEDLPNARKFLVKAPKTVTIQSTEFILTGILKQETVFDKYKII